MSKSLQELTNNGDMDGITLNLLKDYDKFSQIFDETQIDSMSHFNLVLYASDEVDEALEASRLSDSEEASPFLKEWFLHSKAVGTLLNRMAILAPFGKHRKIKARVILNILNEEPIFKACGQGWALCCLAMLINIGHIKVTTKNGFSRYHITPSGKKIAVMDAALTVEDPTQNINQELNKFIKERESQK